MSMNNVAPLTESRMIRSVLFFLLMLMLTPGMAFAMGPPPPTTTAADHDVIIVGAGASGLYAVVTGSHTNGYLFFRLGKYGANK